MSLNCLHFEEKFDQHKLKYIIDNKLCINENITKYKKYLDRSRNGAILVNYYQKYQRGRNLAKFSLSLQNIERNVRDTISSKYYQDIDMINCHPVILSYLCKKNNIKCPCLNKYISNREHYLKKTKLKRNEAKKLYLIITNSDKYDNKLSSKHLKKYHNEMLELHNRFTELYLNEFEQEKKYMIEDDKKKNLIRKNYKARFMNILLCKMENEILMSMWEFFDKPLNAVLCFDGIMMPKNKIFNIKGCEDHINTKFEGLNMELKIKPMDDIINIPTDITQHQDILIDGYFTFQQFIGKDVYEEQIKLWENQNIKLIRNNGKQFYLTKQKNKHIFEDHSSQKYDDWSVIKKSELAQDLDVNCYILNEKNDYDFSQKYNNMSPIEKSKVTNDQKETINKYKYNTIGFGDRGYLKDIVRNGKIDTYNKIDYYPYLSKKGKPDLLETFNIFEGFPLEHENIDYGNMNFEDTIFYKHYKSEFFNNNEKENRHFWACMADIIQDPANIKGTSHLFFSRQGTGKGLLYDFFKRILGINNSVTIDDIDRYLRNSFNKRTSFKLIKMFEEVSEKGEAFYKHNRLKAQQTNPLESLEPKGVDAFDVRHCARFLYFTNNENALYIENSDRRHTMHRVNNRYANNLNYFEPLWDLLKDKKFLKCGFDYLANFKYDKKEVLTCYDTQYKKEQKILNIPLGIQFMIEYIQNENKLGRVSTIDIRDAYKSWCNSSGCAYKLKSFYTQIKRIGIEPIRKRLINKNGQKISIKNCFDLDKNKILNELRSYLGDPHFEFKEPIDEIIDSDDSDSDSEY